MEQIYGLRTVYRFDKSYSVNKGRTDIEVRDANSSSPLPSALGVVPLKDPSTRVSGAHQGLSLHGARLVDDDEVPFPNATTSLGVREKGSSPRVHWVGQQHVLIPPRLP